jgi:hypothetical protein
MAEQTFKAPNFYEREIDNSAPSITGPVGVPAAVVGTSNKGTAFVPVTVANFDEFVQKFGGLDPKNLGPYAANEFLKHRSALTYLRVLGAGANSSDADISNTLSYGTVKNAGFSLSGSTAIPGSDARSVGAVQFLVAKHVPTVNGAYGMPVFVDNSTFNADVTPGSETPLNLVRGMIMSPNTARVMVLDSTSAVTTLNSSTDDSAVADTSGKFKLVISSSLGSSFSTTDGAPGVKVYTVSLDPTDKDYFAKVLNTDPDKFVQEQHYLHADFAVDVNVAHVSGSCPVAVVSGSSNVSTNGVSTKFFREVFGSFDTRYTAPKTTFFISQPYGTTEYDLFKFEALDDGEYANSLYKISISNVKASADDSNKYGTFNVQVRSWDDTDTSLNILEQFTNCTLDPNSPNYIAKLIGDRKVYYNFDAVNPSEKRIVATGKYPNASKYVRVVVSTAVERGNAPKDALPFGFRGPSLLNINPNMKASDPLLPSKSRLGGQLAAAATSLSSSFLPPIPFRYKVTRGELSGVGYDGSPGPSEQANVSYYWGVKFERASTSSTASSTDVLNSNVVGEKNTLIEAYTKFVGIEKLDALVTGSNVDTLNNNKFSLSNVAFYNGSVLDLTSSVNNHMKQAAYIRNAQLDSTNYTWDENGRKRVTFATLLASGSAADFNRFSAYAKFTNFMYGGFDGTNLLNRDSRRLNDKSVSFETGGGASSNNGIGGFSSNPSGQNVSNNGVASYLTAVNIATDPLEANNNLLAIPGIRESYITDQTMAKVRDYGLSMYVMDIPSYDDDGNRIYDDSTAKPNVSQTSNLFDSRSIDNNYAAVYYPDVFIDDATNRRKVKVPASVPALGALAFNDRVTYPWFAPAGFNRAALDFVSNVAVRLGGADKDRLYESRINPIASFPRLGYVIYGQKTLQINKSALDRVNVRRLMLEIKRIIIDIAQKMVFEQNTPAVRNKFVADSSFQLGLIQAQAGVEAFQVVMNESNNTQEDADLNRLNGRIVVVPTRVVEYIAIDFIVTNSGVQFV